MYQDLYAVTQHMRVVIIILRNSILHNKTTRHPLQFRLFHLLSVVAAEPSAVTAMFMPAPEAEGPDLPDAAENEHEQEDDEFGYAESVGSCSASADDHDRGPHLPPPAPGVKTEQQHSSRREGLQVTPVPVPPFPHRAFAGHPSDPSAPSAPSAAAASDANPRMSVTAVCGACGETSGGRQWNAYDVYNQGTSKQIRVPKGDACLRCALGCLHGSLGLWPDAKARAAECVAAGNRALALDLKKLPFPVQEAFQDTGS